MKLGIGTIRKLEKSIKGYWRRVTPAIAEEILKTSGGNRRISETWVGTLARMMTADQWKATSRGLIINDRGELMEGHHRLHAIIRCGLAQWLHITEGEPAENMEILDVTKARRMRDYLVISGTPEHAAHIETGLKILFRYRARKVYDESGRHVGQVPELRALYEKEPEFRDYGVVGSRVTRELTGPGAWVFAMYLIGRKHGRDAAFAFCDTVRIGAELKEDDPRLALRKRCIDIKVKRAQGFMPIPGQFEELIIKAWNLWSGGRRRKSINLRKAPLGPWTNFPAVR